MIAGCLPLEFKRVHRELLGIPLKLAVWYIWWWLGCIAATGRPVKNKCCAIHILVELRWAFNRQHHYMIVQNSSTFWICSLLCKIVSVLLRTVGAKQPIFRVSSHCRRWCNWNSCAWALVFVVLSLKASSMSQKKIPALDDIGSQTDVFSNTEVSV